MLGHKNQNLIILTNRPYSKVPTLYIALSVFLAKYHHGIYYFFPKLKNCFFGDGDRGHFEFLMRSRDLCIFSGDQIEALFIPYQNIHTLSWLFKWLRSYRALFNMCSIGQ
jgi:hypothetical protein